MITKTSSKTLGDCHLWTISFRIFWFLQSQQIIQVLRQQSSPRPSHYHHHIWLKVYVGSIWWYMVYVQFLKLLLLCQMLHLPKKSAFVLSVFSPESWGSSMCLLTNVRPAFVFFLVSSGLHFQTLPSWTHSAFWWQIQYRVHASTLPYYLNCHNSHFWTGCSYFGWYYID